MFWKNFVSLCYNHGKSTTAVVLELGLSRSLVTSWKNGTVPNNTTLLKIATYFNVTVEELISEQKETPPEEIPAGLDELDIKIINRLLELSDEQKIQALTYMEFLQRRTDSKNP